MKSTLPACLILCLLMSFYYSKSFGQIDQIRKKSQENSEQKNDNTPAPRENNSGSYETPTYTPPSNYNTYENTGGDEYSDSYASAGAGCIAGCQLMGQLVVGIFSAHERILKKEKKGGFATSLEILPQIAYGSKGMLTYLPGLRANSGLFSTEIRYCTLSEVLAESGATFSTLDWQIVQFNLSPNAIVNARMGTGIMIEKFSGQAFNEHTFGLDFRINPRIYASFEGRLAIDYQTTVFPRQEAGLRVNYAFIEQSPFFIYITAGTMVQNYYSAVNICSFQSGFALVLR